MLKKEIPEKPLVEREKSATVSRFKLLTNTEDKEENIPSVTDNGVPFDSSQFQFPTIQRVRNKQGGKNP